MKRTKGYTLIELLAVIVILAIIALIATPIVLNAINSSKKEAAKDSAYGYIETIELNNKLSSFNNKYSEIKDGTYDVSKLNNLQFKGKKPTYGEVVIQNSMVKEATLCINGYNVYYDGKEASTLGKCKYDDEIVQTVIQVNNISKTTSTITIPFVIKSDTKIRSIECSYRLKNIGEYTTTNVTLNKSLTENDTSSTGTCKIAKLDENKEYEYKILVQDQMMVKEATGSEITEALQPAEISYVNNDSSDWKTTKTIRFTGASPGATLQYKLVTREDGEEHDSGFVTVSDGDTLTLDKMATVSNPTNLYVRLINEEGVYKNTASVTITTIDTTPPTLLLGDIVKTSKTISIPITANSDSESDISNTTCIYGETEGYELGSLSIQNDNCVIPNTVEGKTYYYKVETENGAGAKISKTGSSSSVPLDDCSISITNENEWKSSKTATITGATTGATLQYSVVVGSDSSKNVAWTNISNGGTVTLNNMATVSEPTSVYCRLTDGVNTKNGSDSKTQTHIDSTAPTNVGPSIENVTTNTIVISNNQSDPESLLDNSTLEYGISEDNVVYEWQPSGTFTNLVNTNTYYFKTRVKNNAGSQTTSNYVSQQPGAFSTCSVSIANSTSWTTNKTATITGATAGANLQYSVTVGSDSSKNVAWTNINNGDTITLNNMAKQNAPTTVYCRFSDGTNISGQESESTTHIDTTAPTDTAPSGVADTESITVTSNQTDDESNVTAVEYGISTEQNGTYNYQSSNVFSGLTKGNDYYIKTKANNNARVNSGTTTKIESQPRKVTTKEFTAPTITVDNANWAGSHTFTAEFTKGEITNAYYYIRSTVNSKLLTNTTLKTCTSLSGTTKDCTGSNVTQNGTLQANTWYQVNTTSVQVSLIENGAVYVATSDGHNLLDTPTSSTSKVDNVPPVVTANGSVSTTTSTATVPITVTDNEIGTISSVTCEYKKNTDSTYVTTNTTGTVTSCSFTKLITGQAYNYRITATDTVGNTTTVEDSLKNNFTTTNINQPTTALNITTNVTTCSKNRTITVYGAIEGAQLQYRIGNNGTWTNINHGGTFTTAENTTIYAKLTDTTNETTSTNYKSLTLTKNGDTTSVTQTKPSVSNITTKSVEVTTGQTDSCGIGTIYYAIKKDGGSYGEWTTSNSFTNLDSNQKYYVKTKANDVAGNGEKESAEESFTTVNINNPTTALDITESPSTCSKSKTMTVKGVLAGTQLQYRIGSGEWTDIANNGTFTLTQNATVYARLYDGHNETSSTNYKTFTVTTYDVTKPGTTAPTTSNVTVNSVTVASNQTDNCGLNTSTLQYGYSTSSSSGYSWVNTSTITGLSPSTKYYIKTRVNDVAGNDLTESDYVTITTKSAIPKDASEILYTNYENTTAETALDDLFNLTN